MRGRSCALAILLAACGSVEEDNPRLALSAAGMTLHLPAPMQQSLDALAPDFHAIRGSQFRSDVQQAAAEGGGGSIPALFAVVGDFDGDGRQDVAVEGTFPADSALVVVAILNTGKTPKAQVIARYPEFDEDAVGIYLTRPVSPKPGAFEIVNYPDVSTLYYYRGGKFEGKPSGG